MKNWIYSLLLLGLSFTLVSKTYSQVDFIWEPVAIHNYPTLADAQGDPELFALDGFVTWRLYLELIAGVDTIPDYLYLVSGAEDPAIGLVPLKINFDCCVYQHPDGFPIATDIIPAAISFLPALAYDSWVTIGGENTNSNVDISTVEDPSDPWIANFENPDSCDVANPETLCFNTPVGGSWFIVPDTNPDSDAFTNEENRLLLGQFTIPSGCGLAGITSVCLSYFVDGGTGQGNELVSDSCFTLPALDPCFTDPIILELDTLIHNVCNGDALGEIQVTGVTNVLDISYEILPAAGVQTSPGVFEELPAGEYEVRIINNLTTDEFGNSCFVSEDFIVTEPEFPLTASLNIVSDVQCLGDANGVIQLVVENNTGTPFTVGEPYNTATDFGVFPEFISPNIFQFDSLDITTSPINFFVQDSNSCLVVLQEILGPEGGVITTGEVTNVTCNGIDNGEIELTIIGWEDPTPNWLAPLSGSGLLQTGLAPNTYSVVIDNGISCADTLMFTITEPDSLLLTGLAADTIACFNDCDGTLTYLASGGTGVISESIFQNDTETPNGELCAGLTELTISDENNCSITQTIVVEENSQLTLNGVVSNVTCAGASDGTFNVSTGSGGSGSYTFTPSELFDPILQSFVNLTAQQYTFVMTDELGCSADTVITITQPNPFVTQVSSTNVLCNGANDGTISVSAAGGSGGYTFTITGGESNETGEFTELAPDTYEILGADDSGCTFIIAEALVISEPAAITIQSIDITEPDCGGASNGIATIVPQGGTPDYIYNWNGGVVSAFPSQTELSAGENTVLITDANGCQKDTIFNISEPIEILITINAQNVTCTGMCDGAFQAAASPEETVELNFGNIPNTGLCEGEYPIIATDDFGCVKLDTVFIGVDIISDIEYTLFSTPVSCFDEADGTATIAVTGGEGDITYEWSDPLNQSTATAIGLVEDFYTVTITDDIGCTFTEELFIEPTIGCFYISNALTPNGDGFNDEWELGGFEFFPENKIEVFNRWGQKVFESIGNYTPWNGQFNSNRLPVADYYYVITFDPSSPPLTGTVTIKY